MKSWHALVVLSAALLVLPAESSTLSAAPAATTSAAAAAAPPACPASASWVSSPYPPQEIPNGGGDFCDFYQFAWQWFLYLASPSQASPDERNFEVAADFPILQAPGVDSCTSTSNEPVLFVRTLKADASDETFVVPERIGQAGDEATVYDKNGNVVFYEVRFSRNLCPPPTTGNLPAGTTEIKTSWRQIDASEAASYFTNETIIEGVSDQPVLLGLVGLHLFRTTALHPEGVWMTWEHDANDPDCLQPQTTPASGWSFASASCAACLASSSSGPLGCASCNFNGAAEDPALTGPPSQICRVYRDGSGPNDNKVAENLADVDSLNAQLVGPGGILTTLPPSAPLAVFANYFNVGGLWVSDPSQPADSSNQRGSLQLSNTTMETTFQGDFQSTGTGFVRTPALNCFGCHDYQPGSTATSGLSHIVDDLDGTPGPARSAARGARPAVSGQPVSAHGGAGGGHRP